MPSVPVSDVSDWASSVLTRIGLTPEDSRFVADSLAFADVRGVSTHGVLRLPTYVQRIQAGGINAAPQVTVTADLGALVILDADAGPGASTAACAADLAIERARAHGIGCVITHNANHFGAAAFFTNRIADAGLLGLAACNTEPVMCAPYGGAPVLGTNPIAVAVPLPYESRPQLDMATTMTSQGRLIMAEQAGDSIPLGWAVDERGKPTTSASAGLAGALLPMGGPKGFGLAFAVDALLALAGAQVSTGVAALNGDPSRPQQLGHLVMAVRADATQSLDAYRATIAELVAAIEASGSDLDVPTPIAPGEPELDRERLADGHIELSAQVLTNLDELARSTGVALPPTMSSSVTSLADSTRGNNT